MSWFEYRDNPNILEHRELNQYSEAIQSLCGGHGMIEAVTREPGVYESNGTRFHIVDGQVVSQAEMDRRWAAVYVPFAYNEDYAPQVQQEEAPPDEDDEDDGARYLKE